MRKVIVIAALLMILNPIIIYSQTLNNDGKASVLNPSNAQIADAIAPPAAAPQSSPIIHNIPPPIRSRNLNIPITQQSKEPVSDVKNKIVEVKPAEVQSKPELPVKPQTVQSPSGVSIPSNPQGVMPAKPVRPSPPGAPKEAIVSPDPSQLPAAVPNPDRVVSKGNFSLSFDDADVYSVIQSVFGEILKVNYIIDARVKGRVTFRSVAPVPKDKVLPLMEVILRLNGVGIIEESGLYRVIPISDLSREPSEIKIGRKIIDSDLKGKAVLQVVPLNYLQSSEIVKLISPFVSANAVIVDVPKANHIIFADTDANVQRILHLIEYFDTEVKEKKGVRVFVHHIKNTKAKDIMTMLQQIFLDPKTQTTKPSAGPTSTQPAPQSKPVVVSAHSAGSDAIVSDVVKIFSDEKLNAVVILGTREDYDIIRETIRELDLVPRQVLIEGTIASIQLTDNMSLGLAWSMKTSVAGLDPTNITFNPTALNIDPSKPTGSGLNIIGVDSGANVRVVINALASQSKAKLMASPHVMVSDNNEARIQVGQQVPIPTSETYATPGVAPQRTIQYKDIGIILKVRPMINDSGLISLQISQEVSTYSTIVLYSDEKQIILNKTEAQTNLVVKDGHTIVIGGLIREDDSNGRAGIPWLSKIPILGYLFGNTTKENNRTELVILLTPHIIKDQDDSAAATDNVANKLSDEKIKKELKKNIHHKADEQKEAVPGK